MEQKVASPDIISYAKYFTNYSFGSVKGVQISGCVVALLFFSKSS